MRQSSEPCNRVFGGYAPPLSRCGDYLPGYPMCLAEAGRTTRNYEVTTTKFFGLGGLFDPFVGSGCTRLST